MTRMLSGSMPGRAAAFFLCNFCTANEYVPIDGAPDRWIGLGRDVHLCADCGQRRRASVNLMDKLAALPPTLLDVVVGIVDNFLQNEREITTAVADEQSRATRSRS